MAFSCDAILTMSDEDPTSRKGSIKKDDLINAFIHLRKQSEPTTDECEPSGKLIELIDRKFDILIQKITELCSEQSNLRAKINEIEVKLSELEQNDSKFNEEFLIEAEQRAARRNNLIISGVAESSVGTVEDRKAADESFLNTLIRDLGLASGIIQSFRRIGKITDSKPRLLLITCRTAEQKFAFLRVAKRLRNMESYRRIFVNPDETEKQREISKQLREELNQRKKNEEDVVIFRGKVVPRSTLRNFR